MTKEEKVYNLIADKPFNIQLGGKDVRLIPSRLVDDYKISSIISKLGDVVESEYITDKDILSLLNAKEIAEIISITAKSTLSIPLIREIDTYFRRKRAYRLALNRATKSEIAMAVVKIIPQMQLFFYRRAIISLKGQNVLKPTKETETTAHMQQ